MRHRWHMMENGERAVIILTAPFWIPVVTIGLAMAVIMAVLFWGLLSGIELVTGKEL